MTRLIVGYCRDASAVPGFQIVETAQRDVRTRNIRGWGSGREGKGTSSLPLILLFVLCSLTSRCTLLPQCLEQARYSEGYIGVSSIIHLNIFVVKFSSKIEWSKILPFFFGCTREVTKHERRVRFLQGACLLWGKIPNLDILSLQLGFNLLRTNSQINDHVYRQVWEIKGCSFPLIFSK